MKCYVVEDLLPEYMEDLCSAETTAEIEAHLEGCEHCKEILEGMKAENDSLERSTPVGAEDIKPFQKVKKKMKRERIKKIVAIVALVAVCGFFGMLTVSQFFPSLPIPSYDSLMYRYKGWKIAKQFVEGDMESVLGGMSRSFTIEQDHDIFFEDMVSQLKQYHKDIFQNKDTSIKVTSVSYDSDMDSMVRRPYDSTFNNYIVRFSINVDGTNISFQVYFDSNSSYYLSIWTGEREFVGGLVTPEDMADTQGKAIKMMNMNFCYYREICTKSSPAQFITSFRISNLCQEWLAEMEDKDLTFNTFYFVDDCNDMVLTTEGDIYSNYCLKINPYLYDIANNCQSNTFQLVNNDYNLEARAFNATLYWTITDLKGKSCIMTKAFYYGPMGYEAVDNTEKIYADDGFDKEILKHLEKIFDKS